jgi:hypothetical protein
MRRTAMITLAAAGALLALPAASATAGTTAAGTGSCLPRVDAASAAAVSARLTVLTAHQSAIAADPTVTPSDRSALEGTYAQDTAGLTATKASVDAATECAVAKATATTIVTSYRVYVLVGPQTHLTEAADAGLSGASGLQAVEPSLRTAIAAAALAGRNVTTAQAAYADLVTRVTATQQELAPVPASMLGLTPPEYPGCLPTIEADRRAVVAGGSGLAAAAKDVSTIEHSLR